MMGLIVFLLVVHCACAYHAWRSGLARHWTSAILLVPGVGCIWYYLREVSPLMLGRGLRASLRAEAHLHRRMQALARSGTIDSRMALAKECTEHGLHEEAIELYESCLEGSFAHDGMLLFYLAQACVTGAHWDRATEALRVLKQVAPRTRPHEVALLEARVLEGRGLHDAAFAIYRALSSGPVACEARHRHVLLLERCGRHAEARRVACDPSQPHGSTVATPATTGEASGQAPAASAGSNAFQPSSMERERYDPTLRRMR